MPSKKSQPNTNRVAPIPYKDFVANNPRFDRRYIVKDMDDEKFNSDRTLYNEKKSKKSYETIKRMLSAYKRRKRDEKLDKLTNDGSLWKGLENYELNDGVNTAL